uniref:AP complex subunit sigma n=1 Tax=Theileria annulata TaxID=5874 RepID=A0A3B0MYJ9_THEAN
MIKFVLLINKRGQTRLSKYYTHYSPEERTLLESELLRKCITRNDNHCPFFTHKDTTIVFRRYASLFFIIGTTSDENELEIYELIHNIVVALDKHFESVCEIDILYNLEKAHLILNEMIANGRIIECNIANVLYPLSVLEKLRQSD